jgi:hypothetical protein
MLPEPRQRFNRDFTAKKYRDFLSGLNRACATEIEFRVSETPCFFSKALLDELASTGEQLTKQLVGNQEYEQASRDVVPAEFRVPNEAATPLFLQVDFGLVRDKAGNIQPKLVELQAFPSLYGYQAVLSRQYIESYGMDRDLRYFLSGHDEESYWELLRKAIVGGHDPANVVLLEIDPRHQKTLPDFLITEHELGIPTVNITDVVKQGNKLFYRGVSRGPNAGMLVPMRRIYNRVIVDELMRKGTKIPFDFRDELEVEWAGHPNWYFKISKFSIPFLKHASVPKTHFLDELPEMPADRENWLLKPLYSFAGSGIVFAPSDEQIAAIPKARRHDYILQERVDFTPVIETPHGPTQAEVRIMYVWLEKLVPVLALVRMGRGKMMGVDHNRDLEWVGASAALWQ